MAYSRNNGWEDNYETYTEEQIESLLEHLDIEVVSETETHFLALCPFHGNTDSPAFVVDKEKGLWTCFNPGCDERGKLPELVKAILGGSTMQAEILIAKYKSGNHKPPQAKRKQIRDAQKLPEFSQEKLDELHSNFLSSQKAQDYMHSRGFTDDTLEYFKIGYSPARITQSGAYRPEMVTVPMHDERGKPLGLIGRVPSHTDKRFKNSWKLPKRLTAWNIHRARKAGGTVVITEASFDAMRVHQAGYPNVIALLGGSITDAHINQIEKYFARVIIMTDFDPPKVEEKCKHCEGACKGHRPGRDLGRSIAKKVGKRVYWAAYDDNCVYPHNAKDAGDMTDDEIRQCLRNAVSNLQYIKWHPEG